MKKSVLFFALIFISLTVFAQKRNELSGPQYKNYKPWMHDTKTESIYTSNGKANLKGPEFKNYKPWKKNKSDVQYQEITTVNKKAKLTGPEYKNYKPWRHKKVKTKDITKP